MLRLPQRQVTLNFNLLVPHQLDKNKPNKGSVMRSFKRLAVLASSAALALTTVVLPASAQDAPALGNQSLAAVLTAGQTAFDRDFSDYDILTAAVLAVLKAKPNSAVKVLTEGDKAVTAFIPNDRAFQRLVKDLTGKNFKNERAVFNAVAKLGIPTVEAVLLYHVVPGATIDSAQALQANGASLDTALKGKVIKVEVQQNPPVITLVDYNKLPDPRVLLSQVDINKGNKQIAHGINRVLLPVAKL
jgi:uncharacterized surface protein with fasciclin (FAS1) repeats